jgi:UDP-glucuronate 4-epimerase
VKYLITGGAGFIGTNLALHLIEEGHEVTILDNFDDSLYGREHKYRNIEAIYKAAGSDVDSSDIQRMVEDIPYIDTEAAWFAEDVGQVTVMVGDILHIHSYYELHVGRTDEVLYPLRDHDVIIHLAGLAGVRPSLADPLRYSRVNVEGTVSILELARKIDARVVFASSSSVYGNLQVPFFESADLTEMISPYAVSKRQGELLMDYYAREYNLHTTSLRFFTVYGPYGRPDMFIGGSLKKIHNYDEITLYGDGSTFRDYTYVSDIVYGIRAASICQEHKGRHEIYNLGCGKPTSLKDLVQLMSYAVGNPPVIRHIGEQKGDVTGTLASYTRAHEMLSYTPKVSVLDGLVRTYEWMLTDELSL